MINKKDFQELCRLFKNPTLTHRSVGDAWVNCRYSSILLTGKKISDKNRAIQILRKSNSGFALGYPNSVAIIQEIKVGFYGRWVETYEKRFELACNKYSRWLGEIK